MISNSTPFGRPSSALTQGKDPFSPSVTSYVSVQNQDEHAPPSQYFHLASDPQPLPSQGCVVGTVVSHSDHQHVTLTDQTMRVLVWTGKKALTTTGHVAVGSVSFVVATVAQSAISSVVSTAVTTATSAFFITGLTKYMISLLPFSKHGS